MNNDLISRSALKKAIKSYADDQYAENEYLGECAIMTIIDNAPSVEERTQGKWIFRSGVTCGDYYKCNKCGEVERAEKNYCPNCGADMRGGAE